MENFICTNCKFKFKSSKIQRTCPYCGKNAVDKEKGANELIEEIENIK